MQAQMIRTSIFRSAVLQEIVQQLITTYLILNEQVASIGHVIS